MKVCVCVHRFPARTETFVHGHVLGLARRGHDVRVIARGVGDVITDAELAEIDDAGVQRVYVGEHESRARVKLVSFLTVLRRPSLWPYFRQSSPWSLRHLLIAVKTVDEVIHRKPDVVHVHFGTLAARIHAAAAALTSDFPPMITTWHGYDANAIPRTLGNQIYNALFASPLPHTVGSNFMKHRLISLGAPSPRVSIVPMGIDPSRFPFRETHRADSEPLQVVSVGRLDEMKGHRYLIAACARVINHGLPVNLRIIGEGPLRSELQRQIEQLGVQDSVTLLGSIPSASVADALNCAHVFALTGVEAGNGRVEAQGVVFAEASAIGLPVIACDVGGVADSVIDGETGVLCPQKDIDAIAQALTYVYEHPEEAKYYGIKGRQYVLDHLSSDNMLTQIEALYSRHCTLRAQNRHTDSFDT